MAASTLPPMTNARRSQPGWAMNRCKYSTLSTRSTARNVPQARSASLTAQHAPAFGAKERLDDHVAAEPCECFHRGVGVLTRHGRRYRQARFSRRALARYLSTHTSSARGGLTTGTPRASRRCSASMRKTTCSSDPGGMVRTITASSPARVSGGREAEPRTLCTRRKSTQMQNMSQESRQLGPDR